MHELYCASKHIGKTIQDAHKFTEDIYRPHVADQPIKPARARTFNFSQDSYMIRQSKQAQSTHAVCV